MLWWKQKDPTNNQTQYSHCTKESIHFTMLRKEYMQIRAWKCKQTDKMATKSQTIPKRNLLFKRKNQIPKQIPHKINVTLLPLSIQQAQTWIDRDIFFYTCFIILQTNGVCIVVYTYCHIDCKYSCHTNQNGHCTEPKLLLVSIVPIFIDYTTT